MYLIGMFMCAIATMIIIMSMLNSFVNFLQFHSTLNTLSKKERSMFTYDRNKERYICNVTGKYVSEYDRGNCLEDSLYYNNVYLPKVKRMRK